MYRIRAGRFVSLPLCLLTVGLLKTAAAQVCTDWGCLAEAVNAANNANNPKMHSIGLGGPITATAGGFLSISSKVSIVGNGYTLTGSALTIFSVTPAGRLTLNDMTLRNPVGNGILNAGNVTLNGVVISGSFGYGALGGGAILNYAALTLNNSNITGNNTPGQFGGGISNSGTLTLNGSTMRANSAAGSGGGAIFNAGSGTVTLNTSTITGNSAAQGGGIYNFGTVTLNSSTVTGNTADSGSNNIAGGGIVNINKKSTVGLWPAVPVQQ